MELVILCLVLSQKKVVCHSVGNELLSQVEEFRSLRIITERLTNIYCAASAALLVCCGKEGAEYEAFNLLVNLHSYVGMCN